MADWVIIRADYVSGGGSFRVLAEKYGISIDAIKRKAAAEKWSEERTITAPKIHQKTVRLVVQQKAEQNADRLTRILSLNDALLSKAERGVSELGEFYIVKRKVSSHQAVKDENGEVEGVADVDETTEVAVKGKTIVSSLMLKQFASALKDLNDIAKVADSGKDESLAKARELLEGLPSAID